MLVDPVGKRLGERHKYRIDQQIESGRNVGQYRYDSLHRARLSGIGLSRNASICSTAILSLWLRRRLSVRRHYSDYSGDRESSASA
jgi:hypothetical protein